MPIEDRLRLLWYRVDPEPHIRVNAEACEACPEGPCTICCPAECFQRDGDRIRFVHDGCLECGTCLLVCTPGAIAWTFPRGGSGVSYRFS
jgi:ferredoxin like protein